MKVRFSGSFLASHTINQRERMQKPSIHVVALETRLISHHNSRNRPTWQAETTTLVQSAISEF